ncbi:MAG: hypothetical protein ABJG47_17165 [Ekhidna sp.]
MKKVLLTLCLFAGFGVVIAQEETTLSDEELTSYATVMVWGKLEKSNMTGIYNGWISESDELAAKRFSEIKKAKGDSVKLEMLEVNDTELTAFNTIQMKYDSMIDSFRTTYKGKIKEEIGNGLYNKIRKALKTDAELKSKYQAIYDGILEEQSAKKAESDE